RGVVATLSDGSNPTAMRSNMIYRNTFQAVSTGIYAQRGNSSLILRCNSFATVSRADIEAAVGFSTTTPPTLVNPLYNPHGECDGEHPEKSIANFFSLTSGGKSIWVIGDANDLEYNHFQPSTGFPTAPGTVVKTVKTNCFTTYLPSRDCPEQRPVTTQTVAQLRAALNTLTNVVDRNEVLDELLRRYLDPTVYAAGLDSAVALLRAVSAPAYLEQLNALEVRGGYTPSSLVVAGGGNTTGEMTARATTTTPLARTSTAGSYFDQVRDLLAPFGTESAILAALQTDSTLRGRLWQIATDTTTWGYVAGQAVLSRYLGYEFQPWYENSGDATASDAFRAPAVSPTNSRPMGAAPQTQPRPATLAVYPNPATTQLALTYTLPDGAGPATLILRDPTGKVCRQLTLDARTTEASVGLHGLRPGLYYYTYSVGGGRVQSGTVVKQP
ncbi:MAG: T9SS type A sorting domain-containing protein, partial [Hymenobacteraceae bacterium]|nr:T9SS type A sorting domain-containing protein [Hymenobacteraceae bacterium]